MNQVIFADMGQGGQVIESQAFFEVVFNIAAHNRTFLAGFTDSRDEGHGKLTMAHQKQQNDFQEILADRMIARMFIFNFFQQAAQIKKNLFAAGLGVDDRVTAFFVITGDRFEAVHAHDNIFQGLGFGADFGVLYAGVDDDDIVYTNRHGLFIYLQKAGAVGDEKYLGTRMCMQYGVPFGAVTGDTDIKKFGHGTVYWIDRQRIENITAGTHNLQKSPLLAAVIRNAEILSLAEKG